MKSAFTLAALLCLANVFALPQYKPIRQTPVAADGEVITVTAPKRLMGVQFLVPMSGVRQEFRCEVRGAGKVQVGAYGAYGWCYGNTVTLSDQWQPLVVSYAEQAAKTGFNVYNAQETPATFEVRNVSVTAQPAPPLQDAEIPGKLFAAVERRHPQGKVHKIADALNGQAVWGRRWYNLVALPVPANSRPFFYYARVKATAAAKRTIALRHTASIQQIAVAPMAEGTGWQWVKLGPVPTWLAYPEVSISPLVPAGCDVHCDRIVLSTKSDLAPADLDALK